MTRKAIFFFTVIVLWAPLFRLLVEELPRDVGLPPMECLAALVLALLFEFLIYRALVIRNEVEGPQRHRYRARSPNASVLAGSLSAAAAFSGLVVLRDGGNALLCGLYLGTALFLWIGAYRYRSRAIWGGWISVDDDILTVCAGPQTYTLPLGQILRVYHCTTDGSFVLETPWAERTTWVPSQTSGGPIWVEGAESLLEIIRPFAPVVDVRSLLSIRRTLAAESTEQ